MPARARRHLLDPDPDDRAQPQRLWRERPSAVAKDPPIDCFYVYPTVSRDQGMNSDLVAGGEENGAAESQFARFASVCRTFAPIYRQMTLASIAAYAAGGDITPPARSPIATSSPRGAITSRRGTRAVRSSSSATARAA